jgi:hypothetical protein
MTTPRVIQLFAKDALRPSCEHLFVVLEDGRVFERFSDQEPGEWSEIPLPTTPEPET